MDDAGVLRGLVYIASGIVILGCAWYAALWGYWEDWTKRVLRVRISVGVVGLFCATCFIWHGFLLLTVQNVE